MELKERSYKEMSMSEKILHSTVLIEIEFENGMFGSGTGLFFNFAIKEDLNTSVPVVITNNHVIEGMKKGKFCITLSDEKGIPNFTRHEFIFFDKSSKWYPHPDPNIDLCALPIASIFDQAIQQGIYPFFLPLDKSLLPSYEDINNLTAFEDILMVGYPRTIWDEKNNLPLLRRGVTATHPRFDFNGKSEFLIDIACFPGSSGSPVFLYNLGSYGGRGGGLIIGSRCKLLGILHAGPMYSLEGKIEVKKIPTSYDLVVKTQIPINLGYVIKSNKLEEFESFFQEKLLLELKFK